MSLARIFGQGPLEQESVLLQPPQLGHQGSELVLDLLDGAALIFGAGELELEAESLEPLAGLLAVRFDVEEQVVDDVEQHLVLDRVGADVEVVVGQRERIDRLLLLGPQVHDVIGRRQGDVHQPFQVVFDVQRVLAVADEVEFAVAARHDPLQLHRRVAPAHRLRDDSAHTLTAADHVRQVDHVTLPAADVLRVEPEDVLVQDVLLAGADGGEVLHPVQRAGPRRLRHQTAIPPHGSVQPLQDLGLGRTDDDVSLRFAAFQQDLGDSKWMRSILLNTAVGDWF